MSKINAIRLINLNYNYNGIRVDDEIFNLNGESTLLSLRNGGGKSVLVQMLIAPFVHKRYRDSNKRKFSSYFTTNKPSWMVMQDMF
jgi:ABC-type antimicrobial peptide transport system ATPase subunit